MDTSAFITPNDVLFMAAGMAGDKEYKVIPRGFYTSLIQEAFNELNMTSMFAIRRIDYNMPAETLSVQLPDDCLGIDGVYVYTGDACTKYNSKKVWNKRNYYTEGNGYISYNKGNTGGHTDKNLIRVNSPDGLNSILFYETENGQLMISSSCLGAGNKIHVSYHSTGGDLIDAPIIPTIFKTAVQDFVIEAAMRYRMANEPSLIRTWASLQQTYAIRLDKEGMNGSWHTAKKRAQNMDPGKLADLATYLGKAAWATGR